MLSGGLAGGGVGTSERRFLAGVLGRCVGPLWAEGVGGADRGCAAEPGETSPSALENVTLQLLVLLCGLPSSRAWPSPGPAGCMVTPTAGSFRPSPAVHELLQGAPAG